MRPKNIGLYFSNRHAMKHLALRLAATLLAIAPLAAEANKALAEKNGCLGCHAAAVKLVGPAYKDIAAKYAGQPGTTEMLSQSIRVGGAGKWGDMAMPAQPKLTEADAKKLATWILGGAK